MRVESGGNKGNPVSGRPRPNGRPIKKQGRFRRIRRGPKLAKPPAIKAILADRWAREAFDKLAEAGVPEGQLTTLLRVIPALGNQKIQLGPTDDSRYVDGLVKRLVGLADEIDRTSKSSLAVPVNVEAALIAERMRVAFGGGAIDWSVVLEESGSVPAKFQELSDLLRSYAEGLKRARWWQRLVFPRGFKLKKQGIFTLMGLVERCTGKRYWNEIAELLTDAHEAAGTPWVYSYDTLKGIHDDLCARSVVKRAIRKADRKEATR